jgi:hypothetical protein
MTNYFPTLLAATLLTAAIYAKAHRLKTANQSEMRWMFQK